MLRAAALTMGKMRTPMLLLAAAALAGAQIYVSPNGNDGNEGDEDTPVQTLQHVRDVLRTRIQAMGSDLTVYMAPGTYRLTQPLVLDSRDSGINGHNIIFTSTAPGQYPVISGAVQVTGWRLVDQARNLWSAPAPKELQNTRQLYIDGVRAQRARGRLPVSVTPTASGYTASSPVMAGWRNQTDIELVYTGGNSIWSEHSVGLGAWTEPRCPIAAINGTAIVMAQPCWDNSTKRIMLPNGQRAANLVGPASVGNEPSYVENAFELLGTPGHWYFDRSARVIYYVPRTGEDLSKADVEAPVLETLISGEGTADAPVHNILFSGIRFEYATWLQPSTPDGFSEIQANYTLTGPNAAAVQGLCKLVPFGTCPYGAWTKEPGNVSFRFGQSIRFQDDTFAHLGGAGLDLGDGSKNNVVEGCIFTDISGNGLELGGVDQPLAPENQATSDNQIVDNHIYNIGAEYRGGIGIVVGYAERTMIAHNQLDHLPCTAISVGWGGWPEKINQPGQANYSRNNIVLANRIFDYMLVLADGGAIYTQGITGPDLANGEKVTGNVIFDQFGSGHAIYTDNGSCNVSVTSNVIFHANFDDSGSRDCDPVDIENNYSQQGTIRGNRIISAIEQAPESLRGDAGLEQDWRSLLDRRLAKPSVPDPPSRVAAIAVNGAAFVTWNPSVYEGEAPLVAYTVTASNGAQASISAGDFRSTGYVKLPGASGAFTVTARNSYGVSPPSLPSRAVTPSDQPLSPPAAPVNVHAFADASGRVSIHFQAPKGGEPILAYAVTVNPGGRKVTFRGRHVLALSGTTHTTFGVVEGLKPGESYTFSIAAVNPAGEGAGGTAGVAN